MNLSIQATILVRFLKLWNQASSDVSKSLTEMAILLFGYIYEVLQWGAITEPNNILQKLPTFKFDVMFMVQLCPDGAQSAVRLLQLLSQNEDIDPVHLPKRDLYDCLRLQHPFERYQSVQTPPEPSSATRPLTEGIVELAWCDDGVSRSGKISLKPSGRTGDDALEWGLEFWCRSGERQISLSKDEGGTRSVHLLQFNATNTGFFCPVNGQRGYVLDDRNFDSPDAAGAPTHLTRCAMCDKDLNGVQCWKNIMCPIFLCDACYDKSSACAPAEDEPVDPAQSRPTTLIKSSPTPLLRLATEVSIARQLLGEAETQRVADLQLLEKEKLSQQLCLAQDSQRKSAQDYQEALSQVERLKARLQEEQERYKQLLSDFDTTKDTRTAAAQPQQVSPTTQTSAPAESAVTSAPRVSTRDRPEDDTLIVDTDSKTHPRDIHVKQCSDFIAKIRRDWEGLEERRRGWNGALRHLGADLYSNPLHFVNEILQNIGDNEFELSAGQEPQIRIELGRGYFMFSSNERGFRRRMAWLGIRVAVVHVSHNGYA